jgi:hypothetical protein
VQFAGRKNTIGSPFPFYGVALLLDVNAGSGLYCTRQICVAIQLELTTYNTTTSALKLTRSLAENATGQELPDEAYQFVDFISIH